MTQPQHQPLDLDAIEAKTAELRTKIDRKNPWPSDNESHWHAEGWKSGTRNALDKLHPEAMAAEIRRLRADAAAELLPAWEAIYEPGNVSDYLIGYTNDEAPAKAAAEAWLRSQAEVTGRLEWEPWGTATAMPDGYDAWFELVERHDDGTPTGPGLIVRRRAAALSAAEETHVVADDSNDPEHVDDCPGCEAFTLTGHRAARP